jgi:hypothetical protein
LKTKKTADTSTRNYIISVVENDKPETVDQLIKIVERKYPITKREITDLIVQLQNEEKICFIQKETKSLRLSEFALSSKAAWFWITITLATATTIAVFTIPEDSYPMVYIRYVLGAMFVLWLPGYTLTAALFSSKELDKTECIALSICLSLALDAIVGLLLNYTPWGIRLAPITLSLLALTTVFATAALILEHESKAKLSE